MSNVYRLTLVVLVAALAILPFVGLSQAEAAQRQQLDIEPAGDFVIGPGKTDLSVQPGGTTNERVTVTNRTGSTTDFVVELEDFTAGTSSENVVQLLGDQRGPSSLKDFINPELTEFTLASGERITFNVDVTVPEDAEPGGRYGSVIVRQDAGGEDGGTGAQVVARLASLFLVEVEGDLTREGQLTDFRIAGPSSVFWDSDGPERYEILFANTGNVHVTPYGQITIKNIFGQTLKEIPIDAYFALPDSTRYREIMHSVDGFQLGRYTAELNLNRSYEDKTDTASVSYWIIPWKVLLVALLIIWLVSAIVRWFTNRFELKRK